MLAGPMPPPPPGTSVAIRARSRVCLAACAGLRDASDEKMTAAAVKPPPFRTGGSAPAHDRFFDHLHARGLAGLWTFFVAISVLTIQDFQLPDGGPVSLHLVRVVEFALILVGAEVNRRRPAPRPAIAVGVGFVCGIYLTSAISGYLRNDAQSQLVTDIAIVFGTATTMPWGPWWQLITVVAAILSNAVGWMLVYGTFANVSIHLLTGIAIAYVVSIYIAYQLHRYRAERDDAEAAVRASEERFRALIERGSDTITIVDAGGNILYESPSVERVLGYRPEELIGRPVFDYVHPDDVPRIRALALDRLEMVSTECRCRRKDGTWCDVEAVAKNLLEHPAVRGIVINWRDIGERKRAEHERAVYMRELAEARDAALAATRTKSAFLANTSHEIRSPLHVVIGMTDMALETNLEPDARDCLGRARAAAVALIGIINDILDLSKIEAGKLEVETSPLDVAATVREIVHLLEPSAAAKGLALSCCVHPGLPADLGGDAARLRQVLTNLIGNAIKFTERGEVAIEVGAVRDTPSGVAVHFVVRDTGIGIPPGRQKAVFESFTQADGSTTRKYGGTGLGLTISRQLVELMGGELRLESVEGQGSTFSFTLDLVRRPDASGPISIVARSAPSAA
jgi:PAS domain S-box-containing protein